jgi:cell division protein FtsB
MFNRFTTIQKSINTLTETIKNMLGTQESQNRSIKYTLDTINVLLERINVLEKEVQQLKGHSSSYHGEKIG